ncbi:MAG: glycoside hydrolase family 99-like domain-containing protein, partial [Bifidobacteriaceae bacterium]|nr:glycoside hydrolase family 99-like domain-containing protein [Bifidobacteriaceae bacterium]
PTTGTPESIDRSELIPAKRGDVLVLEAQARADSSDQDNQDVGGATEFTCQAPAAYLEVVKQTRTDAGYACEFKVVADIPHAAQTLAAAPAGTQVVTDGIYGWDVPGYIQVAGSWTDAEGQTHTDWVRVGLTYQAPEAFKVEGAAYLGQTVNLVSDVPDVAHCAWYHYVAAGDSWPVASGLSYTISQADFNSDGEGRRIIVRAYDAAGRTLAEDWFQPTREPPPSPSRGAVKADRTTEDFADPMVGVSVNNVWEPGFFDSSWGVMQEHPWFLVTQNTPEREPTLGWYDQRQAEVANQHLEWMADYGVDYASYLWVWNPAGESKSKVSIDAYVDSPAQSELAFSLLWDASTAHVRSDFSLEAWEGIVGQWLDDYLNRDEYLRINGKPVVFIHSGNLFAAAVERIAADTNTTTLAVLKDMNKIADRLAEQAGFEGLFLVSGYSNPTAHWNMVTGGGGFDANSAYNYHAPATLSGEAEKYSASYSELDQIYRDAWAAGVTEEFRDDPGASRGPVIVELTAGWDASPLAPSAAEGSLYKDAVHNQSGSTPAQFEEHLAAGLEFVEQNPELTHGLAKIYAWNEFLEGGYVEPHREFGFGYLEAVSRVFGALELSQDQWAVPASGGATDPVAVWTDLRSWAVQTSADWLTVDESIGQYDGQFTLAAAPNPTPSSREAIVTVTAGGLTREIVVSQAAEPASGGLLDCANPANRADGPNSATVPAGPTSGTGQEVAAWACQIPDGAQAVTLTGGIGSSLTWAQGWVDVRFYDGDGQEINVLGELDSAERKQSDKMTGVGNLYRYRLGPWYGDFSALALEETLVVPAGAAELRVYVVTTSEANTPKSGALAVSDLAVVSGVFLDPVGADFGSTNYPSGFAKTLFEAGESPAWSFKTVPASSPGLLTVTVRDLDGLVVDRANVDRAAGTSAALDVQFVGLEPGYYSVQARFAATAGAHGLWTSAFVVLPESSGSLDARFGVDAQLVWASAPAEASRRSAAMLAALGVGSARDRMEWAADAATCAVTMETVNGGQVALVAAELRATGVEDVQVFENSPGCARPAGETDSRAAISDYDAAYNFGVAYAEEALSGKAPRSVEVWNEPNATNFFRGYPWQYASLLKAFSAGVKSVAPDAAAEAVRVLIGGSADYPGRFIEEVYGNNAAAYFDTRNQHFYRGTDFNTWTPTDLIDFLSADPADMSNPSADMSGSITAVEQAAGVADKPGWLTETGYAVNRDASGSFAADELAQAEYLVKSYAQGFAAGYERVFGFSWQEVNEPQHGSFGIVRQDLSPRPAALALAVLTKHLAGAEVAATVKHGDGRTVYFATTDGGYVAVTWGGGGSVPSGATVSDVFGRSVDAAEARTQGSGVYLVNGIGGLPEAAQVVVTPTAAPASSVPALRLEAADVRVDGVTPSLPAHGSRANAELDVAPTQTVAVSVRARSAVNADVNPRATVTCVSDSPNLTATGPPVLVAGVWTCSFTARLGDGELAHAAVAATLDGPADTVRVAL